MYKIRILLMISIITVLVLTLGFSHSILGELTIKNNSSSIIKINIHRHEGNRKNIETEEFILPIGEEIKSKQFEGLNTFANNGFEIIDFIIYNENNEEVKIYDGYEIYQISKDTCIVRGGGICSSKIRTEYYTFIITNEILQ